MKVLSYIIDHMWTWPLIILIIYCLTQFSAAFGLIFAGGSWL